MLRFVDLTSAYWLDEGPPCCAFINTVTDTFIDCGGSHTVDGADELALIDPAYRDRCIRLVPDGFFGPQTIDVEGVTVTDEARQVSP